MWQIIRSSIRKLPVILAGTLLALACFAGNAKVYAGTAGDNAVLLDPFDPVPQIGFHHGEYGGCYDPCGIRQCHRDCGYHRGCYHDCYRHAGCEHDCRRPCDRDCGPYGEYYAAIDRYNRQADMWGVLASIYMDEVKRYDARYGGGEHHDGLRDGDDHHGGSHGDHHDGDDHHDGNDGDHHDDHGGDHHDDGDPHDHP
jgi:hypothetical protein